MVIIVDAYNVLKLFYKEVEESERRLFISDLRRYGKKRGHSMVVVFDGGPYQWPNSCVEGGVLVMYSGAYNTADECIKRYLKTIPPDAALLISSDRQLALWASNQGVSSLDSLNFMGILKQVLNKNNHKPRVQQGQLVKTSNASKEVDMLMEESIDTISNKGEIEEPDEKLLQQKLKKTDRKLMRILKKLQ